MLAAETGVKWSITVATGTAEEIPAEMDSQLFNFANFKDDLLPTPNNIVRTSSRFTVHTIPV